MRYFKYEPHSEKSDQKKKKLNAKKRRSLTKARTCGFLAKAVFFAVTGMLYALLFYLIKIIPPFESKLLGAVVYIVSLPLAIFLPPILAAIASMGLFSLQYKLESSTEKKKLLEFCSHLCEYYGLCEPCMVTKCYGSSDERFKDHDVCIFVCGEELRITTNLKNGIFNESKDLGCYALSRGEVSLYRKMLGTADATVLLADGVSFLLGIRAKKFIEKNFIFGE